jgi:NAD+ kinase
VGGGAGIRLRKAKIADGNGRKEASHLRQVALVINTKKPRAAEVGRELINWLQDRHVEVILSPDGAAQVDRPDLAISPGPGWRTAEMVIVLGGDGTLIRAAQVAAPLGLPILGVNMGHLGFLTELESGELFEHLGPILEGAYQVEERMMLTARAERQGEVVLETIALNDAVVSKGPRARLVHLDVAIGSTTVARYPADGVIVATPTGSTAYSLSAGGPVVSPTVDVLLVTPICPHTMNSRATVVSATEEIVIRVEGSAGEVGLSWDGSEPFALQEGDVVRVSKAPYHARLVRRPTYRFYDVLRQKLTCPSP